MNLKSLDNLDDSFQTEGLMDTGHRMASKQSLMERIECVTREKDEFEILYQNMR